MVSSVYQQQQLVDPSAYHVQAYDQSAGSYYAYSYPQYASDVQQQYFYYNYNVQPQQQEVQQEPKPLGVSDPSQQAQMYYYHHYYQHAGAMNVDPHNGVGAGAGAGVGAAGVVPAQQTIVQPSRGGISGIDSRSSYGGARGHLGHAPSVVRRPFHGRGRGRGRTPHVPPKKAPQQLRNQITAIPVLPPPKAVWCELCKVDCNTAEILETHRQGKKHLKNVKVHEELQKWNKKSIQEKMPQASGSELGPEVPPLSNPIVGYGEMKLHPEALPDQSVNKEAGKRKADEVEPSVVPAKQPRDSCAGRGGGLRHKVRSGKGGDRMKSHHESRIPTDHRKAKEVIPLICELCNIKCDTAAVFQCHLAGKKHLSKAKSFLKQNEILGQEVLKVLSPAILALLHNAANATTSIAPHLHHQVSIPFQGASGLDVNALNFYPPTSEINPESAEAEAMNQPLSFSTNSGGGRPVNMDGNSNKGQSQPLSFSTDSGGGSAVNVDQNSNKGHSQPLSFSTISGGGSSVNVDGNSNKEHSGSGTENANPAPVSLAVAQAERVAACTAFAISSAAVDAGSIFEHRPDVPSEDQKAHPESGAVAGQVQSGKGVRVSV